MSNSDERGAYTPREEPLAFDARQPGGRSGAGRAPTTLIISAAVLILLAAAVFFYYRSGVRHQGDAPRVLGQPVGAMTSPPPSSAQPSDTAEGMEVYNTEQKPASDAQPTFAAAPEQPMPRPAPPPPRPAPQPAPVVVQQPAAPAPKPASFPAPVALAPAKLTPAAPAPKPAATAPARPKTGPETAPATAMNLAAAGDTTRGPVALAAAHAAPTPAKPAAPAPKPAAVGGGGAVVQIGAFSNAAQADKGWNDVARLAPGAMSGHGKRIEPVTVGGKVFQRTYVTGFASRAAAQAFCAKLSASGRSCIVR